MLNRTHPLVVAALLLLFALAAGCSSGGGILPESGDDGYVLEAASFEGGDNFADLTDEGLTLLLTDDNGAPLPDVEVYLDGELADFTDENGSLVDRLTAVKWVLADFVERRSSDRLGLILFGNAAFLQVPFTLDHDVFRVLLEESRIGMAGPQTMMGDAIGLAIKTFDASEAEQRVLILLTDGNDTGSRVPPPRAARIAADRGITIHAIGVGDPAAAGEAPLDEATLQGMVEVTGGRFFRANDSEELEDVYRQLDALEPLELETASYRPKRDLFHLPLAAFLVLLLGYHFLMAGTTWARRQRH